MDHTELRIIDEHIRTHTARAESNRLTAEHFLELAEEETEKLAYWTEEKQRFLGEVTLDNVIPFPGREA